MGWENDDDGLKSGCGWLRRRGNDDGLVSLNPKPQFGQRLQVLKQVQHCRNISLVDCKLNTLFGRIVRRQLGALE